MMLRPQTFVLYTRYDHYETGQIVEVRETELLVRHHWRVGGFRPTPERVPIGNVLMICDTLSFASLTANELRRLRGWRYRGLGVKDDE